MELFLFSKPEFFEGELNLISDLLSLNGFTFHLRKPASTKSELKKLLDRIPSGFHQNIVLHEHHELTGDYELKGIHFPEKKRLALSSSDIKHVIIKNNPRTVSTSFHDLKSLKETGSFFSYVFLSPVFESVSKPGYLPYMDLKEVGNQIHIQKLSNPETRVIALGGIVKENISLIKNAGFDGAGVLGTVWNDKDPVKKMLELQQYET